MNNNPWWPEARAPEVLLRGALATVAVLAATHFHGRTIVALLLPVLEAAMRWAADDFEILKFGFDRDRGNVSIAALARVHHTLFLAGRAIVPTGHEIGAVSVTIGTVLQPLLAACVLVLAWPGGWREMGLRISIAAVLVGLILLIDTPMSMAAWLWHAQLQAYEPGRQSPLVWWSTFLNAGGRIALGLVAASVAVALARRWCGPIDRRHRP